MNKIIRNSKLIIKLQYISIIVGIIISTWILWKPFGIKSSEDFGYALLATFGGIIILIGAHLLTSLLMIILSTIALGLNLHHNKAKKISKAARVLNTICIILLIPFFENVIILGIIIFNIYVMFFRKNENIDTDTDTDTELETED